MSLEGSLLSAPLFSIVTVILIIRFAVVILAILYFIFSLIVVRQIHLMTDTLITEVAPLLRALAIIHAGVALGITILFIGFLFG